MSARPRPALNAFGISFGLAGLAGTWSEAVRSLGWPGPVAEVGWALAIGVWAATVILYLVRLEALADSRGDLRHPVLGAFAALAPIPPLLLGAHLFAQFPAVATVIVWVAVAVSATFGSWFISQLLTVPREAASLHGGYFLPQVAANLLCAQSLAVIGHHTLAMAFFGVGLLFWLLVGGALISRLMTGPELPGQLIPTLGIFSAPPAVAGNAWWTLNGGHSDGVTSLLIGATVAVVVPHLFLIRRYLRLPFTLGFWALTFAIAASATFSVRLLWTASWEWAAVAGWIIVVVATGLIALIGVLSLRLLWRERALRTQPSIE